MDPAIIVGDYSRSDLLFFIQAASSKYELFFLQLDSISKKDNSDFRKYGTEISIYRYGSSHVLIKKLNIKKVFFFALENIHEVLFNICCKFNKIDTVHVEHGLRDFDAWIKIAQLQRDGTNKKLSKRIYNYLSNFKNLPRLTYLIHFFNQSKKKLPLELQNFVDDYTMVRRSNSFIDTCIKINDTRRLPRSYISFSPRVFAFHKRKDHLVDDSIVNYVGFPQFDDLLNLKRSTNQELVYIDQPFMESGLFGWTEEFKLNLIRSIHKEIAEEFDLKFKVKPHPNSNRVFWKKCENKFDRLNVIGIENLRSNDIVLGFASTMLLPLVAQEDTVCFSLEYHPSINFNYSDTLTSSPAIFQIRSIAEFKSCFLKLKKIRQEQKKAKESFVKEWMHIFDGNSYKRLLDVV